MRLKDVLCVVALFVVATAAARVVLAAGAPCTGYSIACDVTPTPPPAGTVICCKSSGYAARSQYKAIGQGNALYIMAPNSEECGNAATTFTMGDSLICGTDIPDGAGIGTCGGRWAQTACTH